MPKLLLAHGEDFSRDMLNRRLQRIGYEVVVADGSREALAAALRHRPDVILLDLDMAATDGRSALRWLKSDVRTYRMPIIVLGEGAGPDAVVAALEAGCVAYETKPVMVPRLVEKIEEALAGAGKKASGSRETSGA
jgi:two-component system, cell cycle response regulator DivK